MDTYDVGFDAPLGRERGGGAAGVLILCLLLCGVFFLSVGAYGFFAGEDDMTKGDIPGAVLAMRELVQGNEAVAVFLGFPAQEEDGETIDTDAETEAAHRAMIEAAARAYIREAEQ